MMELLNACPAVIALATGTNVIVGVPLVIVTVRFAVPVPLALTADNWTMEFVTETSGVPEIIPDDGLMDKPAGRFDAP
jgi:hypothetical protein